MKEYKVESIEARDIQVESKLNWYSRRGWRLRSIAESDIQGCIMLILERETDKGYYNNQS